MPKINYLPDADGSFRLMAHLLVSAIPSKENFYINKKWKKEDIIANIRFIKNGLAIGIYCSASDNFETEKLKKFILKKNYEYLKKLNSNYE